MGPSTYSRLFSRLGFADIRCIMYCIIHCRERISLKTQWAIHIARLCFASPCWSSFSYRETTTTDVNMSIYSEQLRLDDMCSVDFSRTTLLLILRSHLILFAPHSEQIVKLFKHFRWPRYPWTCILVFILTGTTASNESQLSNEFLKNIIY